MKRQGQVEMGQLPEINPDTPLMMMGSCFTTEIGQKLTEDGYNVTLNPFGILFNPASIASSIRRLENLQPFAETDVIVSDNKFTSFFHHSSFSRSTAKEFLENANKSLEKSSQAFDEAKVIIITFGTAWVFQHVKKGIIVSNCHKIPAKEFLRKRLETSEIVKDFSEIITRYPQKEWIFTVSPIRHLADGCHGNQISKSTLLLAIDELQSQFSNVHYFPAYEIMMDELRDFSCYAEDTVHPSSSAVEIIYDRFKKNIK